LNVQVEELQQYGDQLLLHWIRENKRKSFKKQDYREPMIRYATDHRSNLNHHLFTTKTNNCGVDLFEKSAAAPMVVVSDKYDSITRC
jgi:hypothetical protein